MTVRVEEKTLQLALVKAAGMLGVTQDSMNYKVIDESGGFLGLFGKKVSIEAWKKTGRSMQMREDRGRDSRQERDERPRRDDRMPREERGAGDERAERTERPERERREARPPRAPREQREQREQRAPRERDADGETIEDLTPKRELTAQEVTELTEDLRSFCETLCNYIAGEPCAVTAELIEDRLILNVTSPHVASQLAKNSKLAESLEHVLRKKPRHLKQELPFRIFIDDGLRRKREIELIEMAEDLSSKVFENKRPIVLNYRSSYDRKIIHMALDKDERVYTKSIGSGPNRKLMILPSRDRDEAAEPLDA